jgi:hypothetical protein
LELAVGCGMTTSRAATTNAVVQTSRMSIIGRPLLQDDRRMDLAAIGIIAAVILTRLVTRIIAWQKNSLV